MKLKQYELYGYMREVAKKMNIKLDLTIKFAMFFEELVEYLIQLGHLPRTITTDETLLDIYDTIYMKASSFWENQLGRLY
jgi:hypothetical protein